MKITIPTSILQETASENFAFIRSLRRVDPSDLETGTEFPLGSLSDPDIEETETAGQALRRDNVGYAVPVRHKQIRAALNAPELDRGPNGSADPTGDATVFGYPRLTCLSVDVHYLGEGLPEVSETLRALPPFDLTPFFGSPLEEIIITEAAP